MTSRPEGLRRIRRRGSSALVYLNRPARVSPGVPRASARKTTTTEKRDVDVRLVELRRRARGCHDDHRHGPGRAPAGEFNALDTDDTQDRPPEQAPRRWFAPRRRPWRWPRARAARGSARPKLTPLIAGGAGSDAGVADAAGRSRFAHFHGEAPRDRIAVTFARWVSARRFAAADCSSRCNTRARYRRARCQVFASACNDAIVDRVVLRDRVVGVCCVRLDGGVYHCHVGRPMRTAAGSRCRDFGSHWLRGGRTGGHQRERCEQANESTLHNRVTLHRRDVRPCQLQRSKGAACLMVNSCVDRLRRSSWDWSPAGSCPAKRPAAIVTDIIVGILGAIIGGWLYGHFGHARRDGLQSSEYASAP